MKKLKVTKFKVSEKTSNRTFSSDFDFKDWKKVSKTASDFRKFDTVETVENIDEMSTVNITKEKEGPLIPKGEVGQIVKWDKKLDLYSVQFEIKGDEILADVDETQIKKVSKTASVVQDRISERISEEVGNLMNDKGLTQKVSEIIDSKISEKSPELQSMVEDAISEEIEEKVKDGLNPPAVEEEVEEQVEGSEKKASKKKAVGLPEGLKELEYYVRDNADAPEKFLIKGLMKKFLVDKITAQNVIDYVFNSDVDSKKASFDPEELNYLFEEELSEASLQVDDVDELNLEFEEELTEGTTAALNTQVQIVADRDEVEEAPYITVLWMDGVIGSKIESIPLEQKEALANDFNSIFKQYRVYFKKLKPDKYDPYPVIGPTGDALPADKFELEKLLGKAVKAAERLGFKVESSISPFTWKAGPAGPTSRIAAPKAVKIIEKFTRDYEIMDNGITLFEDSFDPNQLVDALEGAGIPAELVDRQRINFVSFKALLSPEDLNNIFEEELDDATSSSDHTEGSTASTHTAVEPKAFRNKVVLMIGRPHKPWSTKKFQDALQDVGATVKVQFSKGVDMALYHPDRVKGPKLQKILSVGIEAIPYEQAIQMIEKGEENKDLGLTGKTVVLTGKPPKGWKKRDVAGFLRKSFGIKEVDSNFTKRTEVVIYNKGQTETSKLQKAIKSGLKVLSYEDLGLDD